jgi:hypothetical protein
VANGETSFSALRRSREMQRKGDVVISVPFLYAVVFQSLLTMVLILRPVKLAKTACSLHIIPSKWYMSPFDGHDSIDANQRSDYIDV